MTTTLPIDLRQCEIRSDREYYGNDTRAINRHSVRCYAIPGHSSRIHIDRILDASPPCYEMYYFELEGISQRLAEMGRHVCDLATTIPVNGQRYWGEGLTWNQAIEVANQAINFLMEHGDE
jgi:hypothetical protein